MTLEWPNGPKKGPLRGPEEATKPLVWCYLTTTLDGRFSSLAASCQVTGPSRLRHILPSCAPIYMITRLRQPRCFSTTRPSPRQGLLAPTSARRITCPRAHARKIVPLHARHFVSRLHHLQAVHARASCKNLLGSFVLLHSVLWLPVPHFVSPLGTSVEWRTRTYQAPPTTMGVVLTMTSKPLSAPSSVELTKLFTDSPRVRLNFAKIFDRGIRTTTEDGEDAHANTFTGATIALMALEDGSTEDGEELSQLSQAVRPASPFVLAKDGLKDSGTSSLWG
jgi:hypothetical protein